MEQITAIQIFWLMLGTAGITGLVTILSAFVTGYLVFRSKREQHETLFPHKRDKRKGPLVRDDFSNSYAAEPEEEGLPDIIKRMNSRVGAEMALSALKKEKVDG